MSMRLQAERLSGKAWQPTRVATPGEMILVLKEAIRSFQKDHNLPVTGSLDNRTAKELGVELHNSTNAKDSGTARKR